MLRKLLLSFILKSEKSSEVVTTSVSGRVFACAGLSGPERGFLRSRVLGDVLTVGRSLESTDISVWRN